MHEGGGRDGDRKFTPDFCLLVKVERDVFRLLKRQIN